MSHQKLVNQTRCMLYISLRNGNFSLYLGRAIIVSDALCGWVLSLLLLIKFNGFDESYAKFSTRTPTFDVGMSRFDLEKVGKKSKRGYQRQQFISFCVIIDTLSHAILDMSTNFNEVHLNNLYETEKKIHSKHMFAPFLDWQ